MLLTYCTYLLLWTAKEVMELVGSTQSVFTDMVAELGLSAALGPETEYTLLAPVNTAFTGGWGPCLSVCLSVCLSTRLLTRLAICLSVCLSA